MNRLLNMTARNGQRVLPLMERKRRQQSINSMRCMSDSDKTKKKDSEYYEYNEYTSYAPGLNEKVPRGPRTVREFADVEKQKNWMTYGYNYGDMEDDRYLNKLFGFVSVTIICVFIPYIGLYYPDYRLKDWAVREAYLEIDRRERLGLPYIDIDLVPQSSWTLPPEEELEGIDVYL